MIHGVSKGWTTGVTELNSTFTGLQASKDRDHILFMLFQAPGVGHITETQC